MLERPDASDPLSELERHERALSLRRRRLHDRIDFLRAGGGGDTAAVNDLIAELERQEREVSAERRRIQERVDALRAQAAQPPR
jgi:predicted  nucleic acid-binding Zn-ribbon protein